MNAMDMVKECVKNSNNNQNATAVVALNNGKKYKLRDMCDLGEVKKDLKVLFFGTNGNIYGGYTDGEKDEDEDGQVYFDVKKDQKDIISLSRTLTMKSETNFGPRLTTDTMKASYYTYLRH